MTGFQHIHHIVCVCVQHHCLLLWIRVICPHQTLWNFYWRRVVSHHSHRITFLFQKAFCVAASFEGTLANKSRLSLHDDVLLSLFKHPNWSLKLCILIFSTFRYKNNQLCKWPSPKWISPLDGALRPTAQFSSSFLTEITCHTGKPSSVKMLWHRAVTPTCREKQPLLTVYGAPNIESSCLDLLQIYHKFTKLNIL